MSWVELKNVHRWWQFHNQLVMSLKLKCHIDSVCMQTSYWLTTCLYCHSPQFYIAHFMAVEVANASRTSQLLASIHADWHNLAPTSASKSYFISPPLTPTFDQSHHLRDHNNSLRLRGWSGNEKCSIVNKLWISNPGIRRKINKCHR